MSTMSFWSYSPAFGGATLQSMQIDPPTWCTTADCPCGGCTPAFNTCPSCVLVALFCGEIGDVYGISGQLLGPAIGSILHGQTCADCGDRAYINFRRSTSEEVRALGFRYPADYT